MRLGLIGVYSIVFMWGGFFDWNGWAETVLWSLAAVLWIVIAVIFVRELVRNDRRTHHVVIHPSLPILLVAPAFLWLTWQPVVAFVLVVVAYIVELRNHSAGNAFLFSFGLVLFIGLFAGLSMVEIESESSESSLRTPGDALFWAFASVLRINYGRSISPVTSDGRVLATVVGVCAVLAASLFTAQVVGWLLGSKRHEAERAHEGNEGAPDPSSPPTAVSYDDREAIVVLTNEVKALRAEIAELRTQLPGHDEEGHHDPGVPT